MGYDNNPSVFDMRFRVIHALLLRDIRTRFGGTYLSFSIAILWPLSHLLLIAVIQIIIPRPPVAGESRLLFFVTGMIPYLAFLYPSRNLSQSIIANRPLLYFPVVSTLDIVAARCIVEIFIITVVSAIVIMIMVALDIDVLPADSAVVMQAYAMAIVLGISVGLLNSAIASVFPMYIFIYIIFTIGLYAASGIVYRVDLLPEKYSYYLLFNPLLQIIEWMRSGYFPEYGDFTVDRMYTIKVSLFFASAGLLLNRLFKGKKV